jgi:hypothetical protein
VIQGGLFPPAIPLVPVLLAGLTGPLSPAAREAVTDLLVEIVNGTSRLSEQELGNHDLGDQARRAAREGIWLIYALLNDQDPKVREWAFDIADAVDDDRERFAAAEATYQAHLKKKN